MPPRPLCRASWCCNSSSTPRCRCPSGCSSTGSAGALVTAGALTMAAGRRSSLSPPFMPVAIAARVLVGAGDAMMFISVLAVVSAWFPLVGCR